MGHPVRCQLNLALAEMVANKARAGDSSPKNPDPAEMVAKDRRSGIEVPLPQGGPQVGDPLLDLL
jgi:hypothetical protein